jgi:hypothetical protein
MYNYKCKSVTKNLVVEESESGYILRNCGNGNRHVVVSFVVIVVVESLDVLESRYAFRRRSCVYLVSLVCVCGR